MNGSSSPRSRCSCCTGSASPCDISTTGTSRSQSRSRATRTSAHDPRSCGCCGRRIPSIAVNTTIDVDEEGITTPYLPSPRGGIGSMGDTKAAGALTGTHPSSAGNNPDRTDGGGKAWPPTLTACDTSLMRGENVAARKRSRSTAGSRTAVPTCSSPAARRRSEWNIPVLLRRVLIALRLQCAKRGDQLRARLARPDDLVDESPRRGDVRVGELLAVLGNPRRTRGGDVGGGVELALVEDVHRPFRSPHRDLRRRPGVDQVRSYVLARNQHE